MKTLCLLLCLVGCAWGATKAKTVEVDGKKVSAIKPIPLSAMVFVQDVRAANCIILEDQKDACIVTGSILSMLATREYVITLDIQFFAVPLSDRAEIGSAGKLSVRIERPEPGKPTKFTALADRWFKQDQDAHGEVWTPCYSVTIRVERYRPNQGRP